MLKILQARLQQYMNHELSDVQACFRNQRSNCQHLLDHQKKQKSSRKTSISALLTMPKPLTVWITINCGILKSRDITLSTKVHLVKALVFPVVMYGCESWTIKKAEHQRIDAFELWSWRRLLRVPWTSRRSNQSILKDISPGCSLDRLMLELKLQNFGHLMRRADSFEKTLMLGKIEGRRKRG